MVKDHGMMDIPLVDNIIAGKRMPKYKLPESIMLYEDNKSSPSKSVQDEELKVYDRSKSSFSSSLHTDPSMRDYDYMIEPDEMFQYYLPPNANKVEPLSIGEGLGVTANFDMGSYIKSGLLD